MAEDYASRIQREYAEHQATLKRDIRSQIVRANGYNPEKDFGQGPFEPKPYPTWVHFADGRPSVIAQNKQEHDALIGRKSEQPKSETVNIAQLAQPEAVRVKRKYTRKAQPVQLPQNLE